ncbi:reprolysin-like metallopeptidase [Yersinia aleksiciae]|uniref:Serralysin n=1 Tax=Yersinia aleksiciae TaxID=263819 RepID=A0ABM5UFU3_YERAE|nr:hypothetical protein [Yersinia aleksiciae]AKP34726.1 hypothetical protein ACZ76_14935 [Yersinia aleksiciae]CFQ47877.1 Cyclolysin [Yersinia aleksiciae]
MSDTNENIIKQINKYQYKWSKNPTEERVLYYSFDKTSPTNILDYFGKFDHDLSTDITDVDRKNYSDISLTEASESLKRIVKEILTSLAKNIGLAFREIEDPTQSNLHFLTYDNNQPYRNRISNIGLTLQLSENNREHSVVTIQRNREYSKGLVAHEIGHALGLIHLENDGYGRSTVMSNQSRNFNNKDSEYFSVNDIAALRLSYGPDTNLDEISQPIEAPIVSHGEGYNNEDATVAKEPTTIETSPSLDASTNTVISELPVISEAIKNITSVDIEEYYQKTTGNRENIVALWQKLHQSNYQFDEITFTVNERKTLELVKENMSGSAPRINWLRNFEIGTTAKGTNGDDYMSLFSNDKIVRTYDGNDFIVVNAGNQTLVGGAGSDTYMFSIHRGQIKTIDSTGNSLTDWDIIDFSDFHKRHLWFKQEGKDLVIDHDITNSKFIVTDYYKENSNTIKEIVIYDEIITGEDIDMLVDTMAAYNSPDKINFYRTAQYKAIAHQSWVTLPEV